MKVLKLDLDIQPPTEWLNKWVETRKLLLRHEGYLPMRTDVFRTRRGHHVYIQLAHDIPDEEANRLQFLLGDDHTRVKINMWRIKRGIKRWNKLFHKVLYRKKAKVITCWYCGNKIPVRDNNGARRHNSNTDSSSTTDNN